MQHPLGLTAMPPLSNMRLRRQAAFRRLRQAGYHRPDHSVKLAMLASLLVSWMLVGTFSHADDVVELARGADGKPGPVFRGEILDIASGKLTIRRADGREDAVPWQRVAQYRTTWPDELAAADQLRQERRFAEAIAAYRQASQVEKRGWVKRVLIARAIACFREQHQPTRAGELFLSLYRADTETPHFDTIPLVWLPAHHAATDLSDRDIRTAASRWLADSTNAASTLLGASWLITAGEPGAAVAPLQKLTQNADKRVALLAEAQLWRTRLAQARESEVAAWERIPIRLPTSLRAGPHFTVGLAWRQCQQPERAALELLRVPIEFPEQTALAATALELAAQQLDQLQRPAEAARLRLERTQRFGGE